MNLIEALAGLAKDVSLTRERRPITATISGKMKGRNKGYRGPATLVHTGGQYIKPVESNQISAETRVLMKRTGKPFLTRNSRCLCGSGKRFKKCCMV